MKKSNIIWTIAAILVLAVPDEDDPLLIAGDVVFKAHFTAGEIRAGTVREVEGEVHRKTCMMFAVTGFCGKTFNCFCIIESHLL